MTFTFPRIFPVRQTLDQPVVSDIEQTVRSQIAGSKLRQRVKPGARLAVAAGSRGINNLQTIVRATVKTLQQMEFKPFVVAGMGTHGGGTAEGQRQVLADYGITEAEIGAPIRTDMDSVQIGSNELGAPVYWDKNAFEADAVVAVNRVKAHTDFMGPIESGIIKMLVIGLGKRESPLQVHRLGSKGMAKMVPASGRVVLAKTRFALGLAILENAAEQTALIQAIEPEELFEEEPRLLVQAKEWMGRLPFDQADALVVGELGKNYSGCGLDPNVIGRRLVENEPDFARPVITRIAVLDVSPESHGNAVGLGLGDLTTKRLVAAIDYDAMNLNTLTAQLLLRTKIPIALDTDRAVVHLALETCWVPEVEQRKLALIPNTLELKDIYVTEPLLSGLNRADRRIDVGTPIEIPFLPGDRLDQVRLFPHSKQARRQTTRT